MSVLLADNPGTSLGRLNETADLSVDQSPAWVTRLLPNVSFIDSPTHNEIRGFCRDALVHRIPHVGIRYWDAAILVTNLLFLLFLLCKCGKVVRKLRSGNSPVFRAFFLLVYLSTLLNIARCALSITFSIANPLEQLFDRALWIGLKFFYLTAELSVLMFALLFGHLDSGTSIRRALLATILFSSLHTALQVVIELRLIDKSWFDNAFFDVHSEGGLVFWILSSSIIALMYVFVLCLPLTCVRKYVTLPSKASFYVYCLLLSLLNIVQTLGALLVFFKSSDGLCLVDLSTFIYFCFFAPLVYFTFLRRSLKNPPNNSAGSMFMYRKQKDENGSGDLPDAYFPRFSGLTSPSYDDLFDYNRDARFMHYDINTGEYLPNPYATPLIGTSSETGESTVTTRTGSDDLGDRRRDSAAIDGTRYLKGLGVNGSLVFDDQPRWYQ